MEWPPDRASYPQLLLAGLTLAVGIAILVVASTSTAAFGAYNSAWDGSTGLRAEATAVGAEPVTARHVDAYSQADPNRTVAVVLSPKTAYNTSEIARVKAYIDAGGTLIVADDFGSRTNPLLAGLGVETRLDGALLRDERYHATAPALPIATNLSAHAYTRNLSRLTLNYPTAVQPHNATVLAATSGYAYADRNRNGELDDAETLATYPVGTVEALGRGEVVVLGDPSLAINAMLDRPDNRQFVRRLLDGHDRVILDHSHTGPLPPLAGAVLFLRDNPLLQTVVGAAGVGGILLWYTGALARLRSDEGGRVDPAVSPPDVTRLLTERHPDWDSARIERIVTGIMNTDTELETDE